MSLSEIAIEAVPRAGRTSTAGIPTVAEGHRLSGREHTTAQAGPSRAVDQVVYVRNPGPDDQALALGTTAEYQAAQHALRNTTQARTIAKRILTGGTELTATMLMDRWHAEVATVRAASETDPAFEAVMKQVTAQGALIAAQRPRALSVEAHRQYKHRAAGAAALTGSCLTSGSIGGILLHNFAADHNLSWFSAMGEVGGGSVSAVGGVGALGGAYYIARLAIAARRASEVHARAADAYETFARDVAPQHAAPAAGNDENV